MSSRVYVRASLCVHVVKDGRGQAHFKFQIHLYDACRSGTRSLTIGRLGGGCFPCRPLSSFLLSQQPLLESELSKSAHTHHHRQGQRKKKERQVSDVKLSPPKTCPGSNKRRRSNINKHVCVCNENGYSI